MALLTRELEQDDLGKLDVVLAAQTFSVLIYNFLIVGWDLSTFHGETDLQVKKKMGFLNCTSFKTKILQYSKSGFLFSELLDPMLLYFPDIFYFVRSTSLVPSSDLSSPWALLYYRLFGKRNY